MVGMLARRHLSTLLLCCVGVVACRDEQPATRVAAEARDHFGCEEVDVRYAGAYETDDEAISIELYEVSSACGDEATYRCEIFDGDEGMTTACCRFGDDTCQSAPD